MSPKTPLSKNVSLSNYWKNIVWESSHFFSPGEVSEIVDIVKQARQHHKKIRVIGRMHSLTPVFCSAEYTISLAEMNTVLRVDKEKKTVQVEGGAIIREINQVIAKSGLALSVLGSTAEQTIAGAISTGTRGICPEHGSLASQVIEIEMVTGCGEVICLSVEKQPEEFYASVLSLGLHGVVTKLTLQCVISILFG
ncbi:MAG: FAD-binding protein [Pseudomonadales bacterium]